MASPDNCFKKNHIVEDGLVIGEVGRLKSKGSGDCSNSGPRAKGCCESKEPVVGNMEIKN